MHVINDWYRMYVDSQRKRTKSLCNTKTTINNAGIPGITKLPPGKSWCEACVKTLAQHGNKVWWDADNAPAEVVYLHRVIMSHANRVLRKNRQEDDPAPLWSEKNRSYNNPYFVAWSALLDQCYNPAHPNHHKWRIFDVDERWWDFDNFIEDVSGKNPTAILPKAGAGTTIGPDACVIMSR